MVLDLMRIIKGMFGLVIQKKGLGCDFGGLTLLFLETDGRGGPGC